MSVSSKIIALLRTTFSRQARRSMREVKRLKRMVLMVEATSETEIACDEAYRLLDEYADLLVRGDDAAAMMPEVSHHLAICLDCREELETLLSALRGSGDR